MPLSGLTSFHSIQLQKYHQECSKTHLFELTDRKIFWRGAAVTPSQTSLPVWRGTSPPHTLLPSAPRSKLAPSALVPPISNRNRRHWEQVLPTIAHAYGRPCISFNDLPENQLPKFHPLPGRLLRAPVLLSTVSACVVPDFVE